MFNLFSASCSVTCLQWARKYPPLSSELAHVNTPTLTMFFFIHLFICSVVYLFVFYLYVCWYLECYPSTPVWLIHFVQGRSVEHIPKMAQCSFVHAKASNTSHDLPYSLYLVGWAMQVWSLPLAPLPPIDSKLHLYNTVGTSFKRYRSIRARDVGWSILDTDFR